MSYGLTFVPRAAGQSWDDALEAVQEAESDGQPDAQVWARIVGSARQILGDVSLFEADHYCELDHEPTGIQLTYYPRKQESRFLRVHRADARVVVKKIYQLGRIVEAETGLAGYDPQLGRGLTDAAAEPELAASIFEGITSPFGRRGICSPSRLLPLTGNRPQLHLNSWRIWCVPE